MEIKKIINLCKKSGQLRLYEGEGGRGMKELNSCPFCKEKNADVVYKESRGEEERTKRRAYVKCFNCLARGPLVSSYDKPEKDLKDYAAECWNGALIGVLNIGAQK